MKCWRRSFLPFVKLESQDLLKREGGGRGTSGIGRETGGRGGVGEMAGVPRPFLQVLQAQGGRDRRKADHLGDRQPFSLIQHRTLHTLSSHLYLTTSTRALLTTTTYDVPSASLPTDQSSSYHLLDGKLSKCHRRITCESGAILRLAPSKFSPFYLLLFFAHVSRPITPIVHLSQKLDRPMGCLSCSIPPMSLIQRNVPESLPN